MDLHLKDKVVLITGAGRGVGRAIALRFSEEGTKVVVNDFHEHRAQRVAQEIVDAGGVALGIQADITDIQQVYAMVEKANKELGPIDILVNNAGIPTSNPGEETGGGWDKFHDSKPEHWRKVVDLNIYGTMNCTYAVLKSMVERNSGKIVSVMSEAGRIGEARLAPYSGAKAGILGFSKAIARELGKHSINVNVVSLGAIDARSVSYHDLPDEQKQRMDKLFKAYPIGRGLKRLSSPDDVANAIVFLASDRAAYITGQCLGLSGGFAMV